MAIMKYIYFITISVLVGISSVHAASITLQFKQVDTGVIVERVQCAKVDIGCTFPLKIQLKDNDGILKDKEIQAQAILYPKFVELKFSDQDTHYSTSEDSYHLDHYFEVPIKIAKKKGHKIKLYKPHPLLETATDGNEFFPVYAVQLSPGNFFTELEVFIEKIE